MIPVKIKRTYRSLLEKAMAPHPSTLAGKSHGRRSLVGCSPWGRWESDTTEQLPFHFSLSRTGEGNGSPLQCSCLENPRDGGARWAAVCGVAQGQTRLKRLSSTGVSFWLTVLSKVLLLLESHKESGSSMWEADIPEKALSYKMQKGCWGMG